MPVTVALEDLKADNIAHETLVDAFGPSSLGILFVKNLPQEFQALRQKVLWSASYLANLPEDELGQSFPVFD